MGIALSKDPTAIVFGEDIGFGGVFRCPLGCEISLVCVGVCGVWVCGCVHVCVCVCACG